MVASGWSKGLQLCKNTVLLTTIVDDFAAHRVRSILSHNSYDINLVESKGQAQRPTLRYSSSTTTQNR
jgi:hypothetical protein